MTNPDFLSLAVDMAKKRAEHIRKILKEVDLSKRPLNPRPFRSAIMEGSERGYRAALIAEYKRCAPGRMISNISPWEFVKTTAKYASAFSVLVEPYWFCGSSYLIPTFANERPVLYKDFVVDEVQVIDAAYWGASGILLIFEALGWRMLDVLYNEARSAGLDVLIEAARATDAIKIASSFTDVLIGLNARDLKTLNLSVERLVKEVRRFREEGPDVLLVAESGIKGWEDYCKVVKAGADAVLVGTSIMLDPSMAARLKDRCVK